MVRLRVKQEFWLPSHMDVNDDVVKRHPLKPAQDSQNPTKTRHLLTSVCSYNVFILGVVSLDLKHDLRKNSIIDLGHDLGDVPGSKS
jgi:hypothetical protein